MERRESDGTSGQRPAGVVKRLLMGLYTVCFFDFFDFVQVHLPLMPYEHCVVPAVVLVPHRGTETQRHRGTEAQRHRGSGM